MEWHHPVDVMHHQQVLTKLQHELWELQLHACLQQQLTAHVEIKGGSRSRCFDHLHMHIPLRQQ
jgi:hypothetical protein